MLYLACCISLRTTSCNRHGRIGMQTLGEMSVTVTSFDRWKLAIADNGYIRNGSGTNIGAQTFNMRRLIRVFLEIEGIVGRNDY